MTEHTATVEPIDRGLGTGSTKVAPAYRYRCTCGAKGTERVAAKPTPKAKREARDAAATDGIRHVREAEARSVSRR